MLIKKPSVPEECLICWMSWPLVMSEFHLQSVIHALGWRGRICQLHNDLECGCEHHFTMQEVTGDDDSFSA